jgi:hypothetical protein
VQKNLCATADRRELLGPSAQRRESLASAVAVLWLGAAEENRKQDQSAEGESGEGVGSEVSRRDPLATPSAVAMMRSALGRVRQVEPSPLFAALGGVLGRARG